MQRLGRAARFVSVGVSLMVLSSAGGPARAGAPIPAQQNPTDATSRFDWSGAYIGGHVGYGRGRTNDTLYDPASSVVGDTFGSLYGGLQIGYNYVFPSRLLLGVEGDVSFPEFFEDGFTSGRGTSQGTNVSDQIDYIATLRGRVGYTFDHWLLYGTGGVAWSQARFLETPGVANDQDKLLRTRAGWVVGAGAEVAIAPDWTARLEYLYDSFGNVTAAFPSGTQYSSNVDIHMLRVGLNYKLGGDSKVPAATRDDPWPMASDNWNIHGQATFVGQGYSSFRSPYEGQNSLSGAAQFKNTTSATAFIGVRPRDGTEVYVNPELMQGSGLSETFGVADFPNGEAQKSGFPVPALNIARIFVRQTFGLGGEQETIPDGPNQLPGKQDISRITITAGKMSVIDYFDNNAFSHDPREDFLSWNMYCCGSYDLTMDRVGYTWGAFAELNQKDWAFRAGYFLVPVVSNDNRFDTHMPDRGEYIAELELRYALFAQPGKLRLMGWLNRANAGSYSEAVALPTTSTNYPDITATRQVRNNYGFVVNVEQAITSDLGFFARASWDEGKTEKIGWTDADETLSLGAVLKGSSWGRPDDRVGLGGVVEALSPEARAYFAAGGLGILIGDGRLNYREEKVLETYYAYSVNKWATLTFDYQLVVDPAYNADRGPVSIFASRVHAEF